MLTRISLVIATIITFGLCVSAHAIASGVDSSHGQNQNSQSVASLIAALKDSNPKVRAGAAEALGQLGNHDAVASLIIVLGDSEGSVRSSAACALGRIKDQRAVEPLMAALQDPYSGVRSLASSSLGDIGDPRAFGPLLRILQDPDPIVRAGAARALGQIKDPRALDPLIAMLGDQEFEPRLSAAAALGELKNPRAAVPLIAALAQRDAFTDEAIGAALQKIGEPAVEPLLAVLNDRDAKRRWGVVNALAQMDVSSADAARISRALITCLNDSNSQVRDTADWGLVNNRKQLHSVDALIAVLKDPDVNVRINVARILGETQDPRAVDPLTAALNDPDATVRQRAGEALQSIKTAQTDAPPPADGGPYRVISNVDLTEPFHTARRWSFVVFEAPDTCDPSGDAGCNGPYQFCLVHGGRSKCSEDGGVVLLEAKIVAATLKRPLLVTTTHPDVATSGSGYLYTKVWSYDAKSDLFPVVFSNAISRNNNEETRIVTSGPLAGDIIVSQKPTRWPYHYSVHLYHFPKNGKYEEVLHFTGGTIYGDGNRLTVIDSEMPELLRRLGLWKPGDPLPVPPVMPQGCTTLEMRGRTERCK